MILSSSIWPNTWAVDSKSNYIIRAFKVPLMYLYNDRRDVRLVTLVEAYNTRRDKVLYCDW